MTTRKTLQDFFQNSKGINQDKITYKLQNSGNSQSGDDIDIDVISQEKLLDLNNASTGMLGDYINFITKTNKSQIKPGNQKSVSPTIGNSLSQPEDSTTNPFVVQGSKEKALMEQYSNSGQFEGEFNEFISKTDNKTADLITSAVGNNLDKTGHVVANKNGESSPIVQLTQNYLIRNNRFTPTSKNKAFKPTGVSVEDFDSGFNESGTFVVQNEFGNHDKSRFIVNQNSVKNLGKSLLLKAGGWDMSETPGESSDPNTFNPTNSALTKNGYNKISVASVRPKNSHGFPEDAQGNSVRSGRGESSVERRNSMFGVINNDKLHFTGKNFEILKNQAILGIVAVRKSLEILLDNLENLAIKSRSKNGIALRDLTDENTDIPFLGKYQPDAIESLDFLKKKLFVKTTYSYFNCVDIGIKSLFGSIVLETDDVEQIKLESKFINSDASYWISVFITALKRTRNITSIVNKFSNSDIKDSLIIIDTIKNNSMIRMLNMFATLGDAVLRSKKGIASSTTSGFLDPDTMPDIASTRVMKSRSKNKNKRNLAWSDSNLPSAYLLPLNVIGATIDMNTVQNGTNPARGMLGSELASKTYTGMDAHGSYNRIPSEVVREIEDRLEAEYVPFYLQDLRTNEIISFNAFITSLTDTISPQYNESTGYGRLDSIKTYKNTTRSITAGFSLFATNKQDYDQMWYKINKLVTMLYPQWTEGDTITKGKSLTNVPIISTAGDAIFKQPFSQVIGATPVVRMRIGDVIKSNYSKFNLSRVFGAGDIGTNLRPTSDNAIIDSLLKATNPTGLGINIPGIGRLNARDVLVNRIGKVIGSPISNTLYGYNVAKKINNYVSKENIVNSAIDLMSSNAIEKIASGLVNGFVNSLVFKEIINKLIDPSLQSDFNFENLNKFGYDVGNFAFLRVKLNRSYLSVDGEEIKCNRPVRVKVTVKRIASKNKKVGNLGEQKQEYFTQYEVVIDDDNLNTLNGKKLKVPHGDLEPDYKDLFIKGLGSKIDELNFENNFTNSVTSNIKNNQFFNKNDNRKMQAELISTLLQGPEGFMHPFFNPVTRAFETNMGRGLAGTLGNISFDWNRDYAWNTDFNSRAPMGVDITLTLSVIHDLPPGIDHSGYNRAPLYNVGSIMKEISGDPNGRQEEAEKSYNIQENLIQKSKR